MGCIEALRILIAAAVSEGATATGPRDRPDAALAPEPALEYRDRWNRTALHWAVVNQRVAALELLLAAGASAAAPRMTQRRHSKVTHLPLESPLHSAARLPPNAALPLLHTLLAAGASANHVDQFGQTPLHVATASCGQGLCTKCATPDEGVAAAVRTLCEAGADPTCRDHSSRTALDLAHQFSCGEPSVVALLSGLELA